MVAPNEGTEKAVSMLSYGAMLVRAVSVDISAPKVAYVLSSTRCVNLVLLNVSSEKYVLGNSDQCP